ncbi:hypothetical protein [Candidatus Hecatella orcuttiae]|jgi:DNA-directed RNA polymerase subunit RPC12/RpoP|uniref:hypothetical protein n=1 Tax=Candidatus Hecatella orcuttiae TaxID=1935119 RepID=UPI002867CC5A|nr:hypothetical protein [Candidatus Hecatella orcuttiae]
MPQLAVCKDCGHLLYKGVDLKPAEEIIQLNGGTCPKCGRKLEFFIDNVEIFPVEDLEKS